jgi:hypothetical protein|nr:MAG TPA: hypothetical protein [Bacteriophage sp.]
MAKIGNWGSAIKFKVNSDSVLTFKDLKRKRSYRRTEHSIIGGKPKVEGLGRDLDSITLKIELNASLGVRPRKVEEKLWRKIGQIHPLVVGGRNICSRAQLTSLSDSYDIVLKRGEVYAITIDATFEEYN